MCRSYVGFFIVNVVLNDFSGYLVDSVSIMVDMPLTTYQPDKWMNLFGTAIAVTFAHRRFFVHDLFHNVINPSVPDIQNNL